VPDIEDAHQRIVQAFLFVFIHACQSSRHSIIQSRGGVSIDS
jgi:hypothetical protein